MQKSFIFKICLNLFLAGVLVGAFVSLELFWVGIAFWVLLFLLLRMRGCLSMGRIKIYLLWGGAFLAGISRFLLAVPEFGPGDIGFYRDLGLNLPIEGKIASEPDIRPEFIYIVLETEKLDYKGRMIPVGGRLLLKLPRYPEYGFGDRLRVTGRPASPPVLEGFSYGDKLAKDGIFAVMYKPKVELSGGAGSLNGWTVILDLKAFINSRINELMGEPAAGIVAGVLLGLRRSIPADVMADFSTTGLTHILAISGYNITLLISVFGIFLKRSSRRTRFFVSVAGIIVFVLLTGMSASVIRAAAMGGLVLLSVYCGRKSSGVRALLLSAALMSFVNPRILLFDMSFQLSFLATLGILVFMPMIEASGAGFLKKLPAFVGEGLCVTLSAQVLTVPLIMYSFGRVSLISPLTNIVFLPLIPLIMFFSFFALISSIIHLPFTTLLAGITWILCKILVEGVGAAAALPLASLSIESFPLWLMLAYYAVSAAAAIILSRKPR